MKKNKEIDEFLTDSGIIFLTGEITTRSYLSLAQQLRYNLYLGISPVRIYINSNGGDLSAALAIIDEFRLYEKKNKEIYCIVVGEACSSAALILGYGTKRFATESSTILIHPMSYDLGEEEHQSTKSYVNYADKLYNSTMTSLAMRCGRKTPKEIKKFIADVRDGYWMDADTAIEFGICDEKWDYSLEI